MHNETTQLQSSPQHYSPIVNTTTSYNEEAEARLEIITQDSNNNNDKEDDEGVNRRQAFSEEDQSSLLDFVSSVYAFVTNQAFYLERKLENGLSKLDDFKERTLNYFAGEEASVAYEPKHHIIEEESTSREE